MPPLSSAPAASLPDRPSAEQQPISAFSRTGLFVLPILAIMGPHLGGFEAFGVNFFPYRIAVLAIIAVTLAVLPRLPWLRNKHMRHYLYVGYVWLTWAALGVIWARSQQAAIRGMFSVGFGFLAFLAAANLESWRTEALRWILRGWIAAALIAAIIAVWEITTGNHLPGSWFASRPDRAGTLVAATFNNPNNYAVFLLAMIPLLLAFLETARSVLRRTALIALILFFISLSVLTSSRVAVYGILLIGLLYLLRRPPLRISDVVSIAIVGAILLLIPVTNRLMNLLLSIDPRFATTILLTGSTLIRLNLALISFDMLFATFGAGIGGGNFPVTLDNTSTYSHRFTAAITDPHNWWLEILSEYGIIVFTLYAGFLAHLYLKSRVASRRQFAPIVPHLPLFFLAFALSGIGPSSFVNQSWQWLYLATIVIAATNTIRAPRNRNQLASANGSAISN